MRVYHLHVHIHDYFWAFSGALKNARSHQLSLFVVVELFKYKNRLIKLKTNLILIFIFI